MKPTMRLAALAAAAVLGAGAPIAAAATSTAEVTVAGGSLSLVTPAFQALNATLTGEDQTLTTTPATPWEALDARGTGAAWSVVASATDLVSTGAPDRVIPSANITFTTGPISAGDGADPAAGMTGATDAPFTVPTGAGQTNVTVVNAPGPHKGVYTFTPTLGVTIPANAQPSYGGSPYQATITVTIS